MSIRLEKFGAQVRRLRKLNDFSQEAFALQCNIDRGHMGAIERGQMNVTLKTLFTIADALKVEPWTLLAPGDSN